MQLFYAIALNKKKTTACSNDMKWHESGYNLGCSSPSLMEMSKKPIDCRSVQTSPLFGRALYRFPVPLMHAEHLQGKGGRVRAAQR